MKRRWLKCVAVLAFASSLGNGTLLTTVGAVDEVTDSQAQVIDVTVHEISELPEELLGIWHYQDEEVDTAFEISAEDDVTFTFLETGEVCVLTQFMERQLDENRVEYTFNWDEEAYPEMNNGETVFSPQPIILTYDHSDDSLTLVYRYEQVDSWQAPEEDPAVDVDLSSYSQEDITLAQTWLALSGGNDSIETLTATYVPAGTPVNPYQDIITDYEAGVPYSATYPEEVIYLSSEVMANGFFVVSINEDGTVSQYDVPSHWHTPMTAQESLDSTQAIIDNASPVALSDISDQAVATIIDKIVKDTFTPDEATPETYPTQSISELPEELLGIWHYQDEEVDTAFEINAEGDVTFTFLETGEVYVLTQFIERQLDENRVEYTFNWDVDAYPGMNNGATVFSPQPIILTYDHSDDSLTLVYRYTQVDSWQAPEEDPVEEAEVDLSDYSQADITLAQTWLTLSGGNDAIDTLTATYVPAGTPVNPYQDIITDYEAGVAYSATYPQEVIYLSSEVVANGFFVVSINEDGTVSQYNVPSHWHTPMTAQESLDATQAIIDNASPVELSESGNQAVLTVLESLVKEAASPGPNENGNETETETTTDSETTTTVEEQTESAEKERGFLPATGESGTMIGILIGAVALIAGLALVLTGRKKQSKH